MQPNWSPARPPPSRCKNSSTGLNTSLRLPAPLLRDCAPSLVQIASSAPRSHGLESPANPGRFSRRIRHAAISCSFQGNQLVLNVVQLYQPRTVRGFFKMQRNCLEQVGAQFIPAISFSEYAVAQRASVEATFLGIANLEDQLHALRIPKRGRRLRANIGVRSRKGPIRMAKKQLGMPHSKDKADGNRLIAIHNMSAGIRFIREDDDD